LVENYLEAWTSGLVRRELRDRGKDLKPRLMSAGTVGRARWQGMPERSKKEPFINWVNTPTNNETKLGGNKL